MATFPEWVEARPIEKSDTVEWARLLTDVQKTDGSDEYYDPEDLVEELSDPKLKADLDTVGLWVDGEMVAFGVVLWRTNLLDVDRLNTDSAVGPAWRRRDLGKALMTWMVSRARELHEQHHPEAEAELNASVISTNTGAA